MVILYSPPTSPTTEVQVRPWLQLVSNPWVRKQALTCSESGDA